MMMPSPRRATCRPAAAPSPSPRAGFTLISVLMAIALLTIGLLALGRTQAMVVSSQATATTRTSALEVARSYMEEVRARDPWTLATEPAVKLALDGAVDAAGPLSRSLEVVASQPNLLQVTVRVADTRRRTPVELVTYVYRGAR